MKIRRNAIYLAGALLALGGALFLFSRVQEHGMQRAESGDAGAGREAGLSGDSDGATRLGGRGENQEKVPPDESDPDSAREEWACDMVGLVMELGGPAPSTAGASVGIMLQTGELIADLPVSQDGTFSGRVPLPEPAVQVWCIARDRESGGVSPVVTQTVAHSQRVGLVFFLMRGAQIEARLVDAAGMPVPSGRLMVLEKPERQDQPVKGWTVEAWRHVTQVVRAEEDGHVRIPVRPGYLQVRALGPDGTLGPAREFTLAAGELVDAGDLRVPSATVLLRGRVHDRISGAPVEGAWVQPDGLLLRWHEEGRPDTAIRSDSDGVFEMRVSPESSPVRTAVGSPHHEAVEVVLDPDAQEAVVELEPRPVLRMRLETEGSASQEVATLLMESAPWSVVNTGRHSGFTGTPGPSVGPFFWVRDALLRTPVPVTPGDAPREVVARPPFAGTYDVSFRLPGGFLAKSRVGISQGEDKTVALRIPALIPTHLRFHVQRPEDDVGPSPEYTLQWLAADGKELWRVRLDPGPEQDVVDVVLWRLAGARRLRLLSLPSGLRFPTTEAVLNTDPGATTDVQLPARSDMVPVTLQLTYRGLPIPLGHVSLQLVPTSPVFEDTRRGIGVRTDAHGRAQVCVPPGAYKAVSLRRFGDAHWIEFIASEDRTDVVLLPTDP